jgi:short-subunit dehydrogenase
VKKYSDIALREMKDTAVVIGASKGLGRALSYLLAENNVNVILAARSNDALERITADISARHKVSAVALHIDLELLTGERATQFVNNIFQHYPMVNQVYITAGIISDADAGTESINVLKKIFEINCLGICYLAEAFCKKLSGTESSISIVSSVAAVRPRRKNIAYASSKIALEYFIGGLQHYFWDDSLRLHLYRIGYMSTGMTAGKKLLLPSTTPETAARFIFNHRDNKFRMKYFPWFWMPVSLVLKFLPWFLFKKIKQ